MRRTLEILLLGLIGCVAGSQGDFAPKPEVESEAGGEVSAVCGALSMPGKPVAMDFVHPSVGVSGLDAAGWLAGEHVVAANVWLPWWSVQPSARDPLGALTIAIIPKAAFDGGPYLHLGAAVRVKDAQGTLLLEQDDVIFSVSSLESAYVSLEFENAALAARLGLPPAAQPAQAADVFRLDISWLRKEFSASLGSVRAGTTCPLWQPKPEPSICEPGAGLLVMEDDAITEPRDLHATLVGDFAPIDAIEELRKQALEVSWPEGGSARLHVTYEPSDHACVTEGYVHVFESEYHATRATGFKVVVPLHASLRTDDGRLLVRMSGFAEALVAHDHPWDRHVDASLGYQEGGKLAQGERLGFSVPAGSLGFLSGWLRSPMTDSHPPQLSFSVCTPYPGVPPFPSVSESWSNRLTCFCASEQRAEAPLHLSATRSP